MFSPALVIPSKALTPLLNGGSVAMRSTLSELMPRSTGRLSPMKSVRLSTLSAAKLSAPLQHGDRDFLSEEPTICTNLQGDRESLPHAKRFVQSVLKAKTAAPLTRSFCNQQGRLSTRPRHCVERVVRVGGVEVEGVAVHPSGGSG